MLLFAVYRRCFAVIRRDFVVYSKMFTTMVVGKWKCRTVPTRLHF